MPTEPFKFNPLTDRVVMSVKCFKLEPGVPIEVKDEGTGNYIDRITDLTLQSEAQGSLLTRGTLIISPIVSLEEQICNRMLNEKSPLIAQFNFDGGTMMMYKVLGIRLPVEILWTSNSPANLMITMRSDGS